MKRPAQKSIRERPIWAKPFRRSAEAMTLGLFLAAARMRLPTKRFLTSALLDLAATSRQGQSGSGHLPRRPAARPRLWRANQIGGARDSDGARSALRTMVRPTGAVVVAARFLIFQWHDDTFGLPPDASSGPSGEAANQAFRIGRADLRHPFPFRGGPAASGGMEPQIRRLYGRASARMAGAVRAGSRRHGPGADAAGLAIARAWAKLISL